MRRSAVISMFVVILVFALAIYGLASNGTMSKPDSMSQRVDQMQQKNEHVTDQSTAAPEGAGPAMMCMGCGIAVDDSAIYILRGDQLVKLNKNTMEVISTVTLPAMRGGAAMVMPSQPISPAASGSGPGNQICLPAPGIPSGAGPSQSAQSLADRISTMPVAESELAYLNAIIENKNAQFAWSKLAAENASRANLRRFANRILDESPSITSRLSRRLRDWYQVRAAMSLTPEDTQILNTLQTLQGRDFDIAYMQAMLSQMQGSMVLSRSIASRSTREELIQIANNIADSDAQKIQQLRTWLSEWYQIRPS